MSLSPDFSGDRVTRSSVLCILVCRSLFVLLAIVLSVLLLLAIVLSVLLRFTDSDYPFGIFKLFLSIFYSSKPEMDWAQVITTLSLYYNYNIIYMT